MRVALVVTDLGLGGTQAFVELAAVQLVGRGHHVTVFAEHGPFDRQARLESAGVTVKTFAAPPTPAEFGRFLVDDKIQIVHLNVWERIDELSRLGWETGIPTALSYHHVPLTRVWRERLTSPRLLFFYLRDLNRALHGPDAHIGCCETSARALQQQYGPFFNNRIFALRNAIPLPEPTSDDVLLGPPRLLQVGALTVRKNPFDTLRGFAAIVKEFSSATLTLIGDGPEKPRLESFVAEHNVPGVTFAGEVADPSGFYSRSNIMVLPSFREGLPYTLIEAAGRGIPIVAAAVDGIPEIVHNDENGILVEPGDVAGVETALRMLVSDPARRLEMGRHGRRIVEEDFGIDRFTDLLIDIYQAILARTGTKGRK